MNIATYKSYILNLKILWKKQQAYFLFAYLIKQK